MRNYILFILFSLFIGQQQIDAQCFPNRHSTNWFDAWVSCEMSPNPNVAHGNSHWIMYDMGSNFELGQTYIWNFNDPEELNNGIKQLAVDYSIDGINWISTGTLNIARATGKSYYEGENGIDFEQITARYVLLTSIENWGGNCVGFSEIKIEAKDLFSAVDNETQNNSCIAFSIIPNPVKDRTTLQIKRQCDGDFNILVYDLLGKLVHSQFAQANNESNQLTIPLNIEHLPTGQFTVELEQNNSISRQSLIKIK